MLPRMWPKKVGGGVAAGSNPISRAVGRKAFNNAA
jgi:hypothetical protein